MLYHQEDMHTITPKMEEDMAFQKGVIINQILKRFSVSKLS
jgi:hypothetical protein